MQTYLKTIPISTEIYQNKKVCLLGCGASLDNNNINFSSYDIVVGTNRIYQTEYFNNINILYYNVSRSDKQNLMKLLYKISTSKIFQTLILCPWNSGPKKRKEMETKLQEYSINNTIYAKSIARKLTQIKQRPLTDIAAMNHILLSKAQKVHIYGFDFYSNQYIKNLKHFNNHNNLHDLESNRTFFLDTLQKHKNIITWYQ